MSTAAYSDPVRLLVYGAGGRMGSAVLSLLPQVPGLRLVAAVSRSDHPLPPDVPDYPAEALATVPDFDVAIDFSLAPGFDPLLDECLRRGAALVSGTTGLSPSQRLAIEQATQRIAVLWTSNFSPGMAVLQRLVERAAAALPDWDCEILDLHHRHKRDAPSGSAISLAEAVTRGRGDQPGWSMRDSDSGLRRTGEVSIASQRGGEVVGEHTVSLFGPHERLELTHRAEDRGVFAYGALLAAERLIGRPAGLYQLADLILPGG
jgi:4-hydroxy-tetrahydrodipicolinate reductase